LYLTPSGPFGHNTANFSIFLLASYPNRALGVNPPFTMQIWYIIQIAIIIYKTTDRTQFDFFFQNYLFFVFYEKIYLWKLICKKKMRIIVFVSLYTLIIGENCYVCQSTKREVKDKFLQNERPSIGSIGDDCWNLNSGQRSY